MKIAADQLKELSKKLRGLGGELFNFNGTQAYTSVPNLDLVVDFKTDAGFAVSGEKFSQIVARLNGDVDFSTTDTKLVLKAKGSKHSIPITEPKYPVHKWTESNAISVPSASLNTALQYALQATESGSAFNYTGAVSLSSKFVAATDGQRLSFCESGGGPEVAVYIPVPAVQALKTLSGPAIFMWQNEANLYFRSEGTTLIARRMVKSFPSWEKLIPATTQNNFTFKNEELRNALKSLQPLTEEKQKINLTISDESAIITVTSQQGDGDVTIPATGADDFFLGFSCSLPFHHLLDFVESVKEDIRMGANSEKGPFLLEAGKFKLIIAGQK